MIAFILATSDIWVKMKTAGRQDEASPELNFILHAHLCCYFETRPVPSGLCEGAFCLCGIVESTGIGRVVHFFSSITVQKTSKPRFHERRHDETMGIYQVRTNRSNDLE